MKYTRITINPERMGGVPCIRNFRIAVATIQKMMAQGLTREEILQSFPDLQGEDLDEALIYAAEAAEERDLPLSPSE